MATNKIEITNDGKGKPQSFEAIINNCKIDSNTNYNFNIEGYGSSKTEAMGNILNSINAIIEELKIYKVQIMNRDKNFLK